MLEDIVETIERHTGTRPRGWLSPWLASSEQTMDLFPEYGFTYACDFPHDDQPFPIRVKSGPLISMPNALELCDVLAYLGEVTPADYCRMLREALDNLYAEAVRNDTGYVMCVTLHPFIVAQPHHLRVFDETWGT